MNGFLFAYDNLPLNFGVTYHVKLAHMSREPTITGAVSTNGQIYTSLPNVFLGPISDFRLDTLSISSYSDAGDTFGDSILAHGVVDNFTVTMPAPPIVALTGTFTDHVWSVDFLSRTNWVYTLERTADFQTWLAAESATPGTGTNLFLQ